MLHLKLKNVSILVVDVVGTKLLAQIVLPYIILWIVWIKMDGMRV